MGWQKGLVIIICLKFIVTIFIVLNSLIVVSQTRNFEPLEPNDEALMKAETAFIEGQRHLILENYAKALEMFRTAEEINPYTGAISFKIAEILYKNKDYDKAIGAAEKAIKFDPTNRFYHVLAADIETARSDLSSAQKHYENLIKLPKTKDYLDDLALLYEYQGKYKKALETFKKIQDHFGTNKALVNEIQKIHVMMGEPELGLVEWERLVDENPDDTEYIYTLADQYLVAGHTDKAEDYLRKILTLNPTDGRAGLMMAEILKNSGKMTEALQAARPSLLSTDVDFSFKGGILTDLLKTNSEESSEELKQLVKDMVALHENEYTAQAFAGDVLFQLGAKEESIEYYLRAIRISPSNFSVWQNILSMEAEFSKWDSLIVHSEKAIEYFPNQGVLYYFGGTGYLQKKNFNRAAGLLEIGKRYALDKGLLSVFEGQLGDVYHGSKNKIKSDQAYAAALHANPENIHVLNNYSYYLALDKRDLEKALIMSSKLVKLIPDNPNYLDTHGWVLFSKGNFKEAKKHLQKAAASGDNANILEHYGDVLIKLGQTDQALEQWKKAVSLGTKSELIYKKIADKKYYE